MAPDYSGPNQSSSEHTDTGATMEIMPEPFVVELLSFLQKDFLLCK